MIQYDYKKLEGKIIEHFNCNVNFAIKMGFSERTLSLKMNNKSDFRQNEISLACSLLKIPYSEIPEYFFKKKTQRN